MRCRRWVLFSPDPNFPLHSIVNVTIVKECRQGTSHKNQDGVRSKLLHQLFVDDTRLFKEIFLRVTLLISLYKQIFGAKFNLSKSIPVQLNSGPVPRWFS